jgi:hypothetical protein
MGEVEEEVGAKLRTPNEQGDAHCAMSVDSTPDFQISELQ